MCQLLVRVGDEALIVGRQVAHDGLVTLFKDALHFLRSLAFGCNGGVNDKPQWMPCDEVDALLSWKDIEAAVYRDRNDGQTQFVGQLECSSAELRHVACEGACPFGKDDEGNAMLQDLAALLVGLVDGFRSALIDEDVSGALACLAYEGNVAQGLLHHPAEAASQKAVDEEDVVGTLMVGNEDIGLPLVQQLLALHLDGQEHYPAHQPAPYHRRIVAPRSCLAERAADDGSDGGQDRCQNDERQGDEKLVKAIEDRPYPIPLCYGSIFFTLHSSFFVYIGPFLCLFDVFLDVGMAQEVWRSVGDNLLNLWGEDGIGQAAR